MNVDVVVVMGKGGAILVLHFIGGESGPSEETPDWSPTYRLRAATLSTLWMSCAA